MKKRSRNILLICFAVLLVLGAAACVVGVAAYRAIVCNATSNDGIPHSYYIYPGAPLDSVFMQVATDYHIISERNLRLYARRAGLVAPKPGYYQLPASMSSRSLVNHLLLGWQTPIQLSFTNEIRNREQLAARLDQVLLLDSATIMQHLDSLPFLAQYEMNKETAVCLFIPNTYEVYWTISAEDLFQRMYAEYRRFWNEDRLNKAHAKGLTPVQVATLASIVEGETYRTAEHPTIASLYLNRIKKNMPLQACPTVIFAVGDFTMHRVLSDHLQLDSPYNTYKYKGLPPGPIRLPNGETMDAVLNAPETDYIFMCANPDWSGTHVFTKTYAEHQKVARAYQQELNRRNIMK